MRIRLIAICAVLLGIELAFLPLPGIQQDEVLFVAPYLRNNPALYSWHIGGLRLPVMSMAYLGYVESWLYWPVFHFWRPGMWSIRLPEAIVSILTVVILCDLVRRVAGTQVALTTALLLATDAVFVMNSLFETTASVQLLGIVVFLNLLQRRRFTAAFFTAGVLFWEKVNIVFPMAGAGLGFALIYPGAIRQALTLRKIVFAMAAVVIGAAPLIAFNVHDRGASVRAAGSLPAMPPAEKVMMMRRTLDGRAYEHYMFRSSPGEVLPLLGEPLGDLALNWYRESNFHPGSFLLPAFLLSFFALPSLRGSALWRPVLFSWVAFLSAFGSMFFFADAGAGPHHTVLTYPAPHFIVAATGMALTDKLVRSRTQAFAAICVLIAGSGCWLLGQYYRAAIRNGFSVFWTDGLTTLADQVRQEGLPVAVTDWGIHNGLQIETSDRIEITEDVTPREGVLYVGHCDRYIVDPSRRWQFDQLLASSGLRIVDSRTTTDREGHPVFCSFRLSRKAAGD